MEREAAAMMILPGKKRQNPTKSARVPQFGMIGEKTNKMFFHLKENLKKGFQISKNMI